MNAHAQDEIDHNVLLQIETAGITPSPEAEKATLARRLFIDVTGLLSTIWELETYMGNDSPNANEGLVEKLLTTKPYRTH